MNHKILNHKYQISMNHNNIMNHISNIVIHIKSQISYIMPNIVIVSESYNTDSWIIYAKYCNLMNHE